MFYCIQRGDFNLGILCGSSLVSDQLSASSHSSLLQSVCKYPAFSPFSTTILSDLRLGSSRFVENLTLGRGDMVVEPAWLLGPLGKKAMVMPVGVSM